MDSLFQRPWPWWWYAARPTAAPKIEPKLFGGILKVLLCCILCGPPSSVARDDHDGCAKYVAYFGCLLCTCGDVFKTASTSCTQNQVMVQRNRFQLHGSKTAFTKNLSQPLKTGEEPTNKPVRRGAHSSFFTPHTRDSRYLCLML